MSWTINFIGALFLTTVTGSIWFLFWYPAAKKLDEMGYVNLLYDTLRLGSFFFGIPLVYLLFCHWDDGAGVFGGVLFLHTETLTAVCQGIFWIWLAGALGITARSVVRVFRTWWHLRDREPGRPEEQEQFREICGRFKIAEGKVSLYRSYHVGVPCTVGIFKPCVLLPEEDYTEKERKVFFFHELTHYRQKDLWLKLAVLILVCINWFNPLIYRYCRMVELWSEYACDHRACLQISRTGDYMKVLIETALKIHSEPTDTVASLAGKESEVMRRVKRLKRYSKMKKKPGIQAAAVCLVLCLLSSTTVLAASAGAAKQYVKWYRETVVEIEEELQEPEELVEYIETEATPGVVEEIGETFGNARFPTKYFAWAVGNNALKKTDAFYVEEARSIEVYASITPSDKQVRFGIIEPSGTKRYILVTGSGSHTFYIKRTGDYRVFVENTSGVSVEAGGTYTIR